MQWLQGCSVVWWQMWEPTIFSRDSNFHNREQTLNLVNSLPIKCRLEVVATTHHLLLQGLFPVPPNLFSSYFHQILTPAMWQASSERSFRCGNNSGKFSNYKDTHSGGLCTCEAPYFSRWSELEANICTGSRDHIRGWFNSVGTRHQLNWTQ